MFPIWSWKEIKYQIFVGSNRTLRTNLKKERKKEPTWRKRERKNQLEEREKERANWRRERKSLIQYRMTRRISLLERQHNNYFSGKLSVSDEQSKERKYQRKYQRRNKQRHSTNGSFGRRRKESNRGRDSLRFILTSTRYIASTTTAARARTVRTYFFPTSDKNDTCWDRRSKSERKKDKRREKKSDE